ncbi:MAG TPA: ribosome silencing factor [Nitrococcus sp.]|nr:ribosome silencing factor [Nitrococcus sp.]
MIKPGKALEEVQRIVQTALEDIKAENVVVLDVRRRTSITDLMVFASGRSRRHVRSIADRVLEAAKHNAIHALGVEGEDSAEWILIDLGDVVVHVMQPATREFYRLEHVWGMESEDEIRGFEERS